jgi:hypothetical protein
MTVNICIKFTGLQIIKVLFKSVYIVAVMLMVFGAEFGHTSGIPPVFRHPET